MIDDKRTHVVAVKPIFVASAKGEATNIGSDQKRPTCSPVIRMCCYGNSIRLIVTAIYETHHLSWKPHVESVRCIVPIVVSLETLFDAVAIARVVDGDIIGACEAPTLAVSV